MHGTTEQMSCLPALWHAADDSGRRLLTGALFEKVEVLGVGPDGRAERSRAYTFQIAVTIADADGAGTVIPSVDVA